MVSESVDSLPSAFGPPRATSTPIAQADLSEDYSQDLFGGDDCVIVSEDNAPQVSKRYGNDRNCFSS